MRIQSFAFSAAFKGVGSADVRVVYDYFMECVRKAQLSECALLAEYIAEFDADPNRLSAARAVISTAQINIGSPQAEIRKILPTLIARNHRNDLPADIRRCLNVRQSAARSVEVYRDESGQEREAPGSARIEYEYFLQNKCGRAVDYTATCDVGVLGQAVTKAGRLASGGELNITHCTVRR